VVHCAVYLHYRGCTALEKLSMAHNAKSQFSETCILFTTGAAPRWRSCRWRTMRSPIAVDHASFHHRGCTALEKLSMAHNEVAELGDSLAGLPSLQELRVGHNELARCAGGTHVVSACRRTRTTLNRATQCSSLRATSDACACATPGVEMPACWLSGCGQNQTDTVNRERSACGTTCCAALWLVPPLQSADQHGAPLCPQAAG
jgi:hypothetical protein